MWGAPHPLWQGLCCPVHLTTRLHGSACRRPDRKTVTTRNGDPAAHKAVPVPAGSVTPSPRRGRAGVG